MGLGRGEIGELLFEQATEFLQPHAPQRGGLARFEGHERFEHLGELALRTGLAQTLGPQLEHSDVAPRRRIPRSLEGVEGCRGPAPARVDLRQLDEQGLRNPWASLSHQSLEHPRERLVVSLFAFEVRPGMQHGAVVLGELHRAFDPGARVGG